MTVAPPIIFFFFFKIKPDVYFISFSGIKRENFIILSQKCKNCKVLQQMKVFIWNKSASNVPLCMRLQVMLLTAPPSPELAGSACAMPRELCRKSISQQKAWHCLYDTLARASFCTFRVFSRFGNVFF